MSMEKIGNFTNTLLETTSTPANRRQPNSAPRKTEGDSVSIRHSEHLEQGNTVSATKVYWPPLFPIGDTQSIFKTGK